MYGGMRSKATAASRLDARKRKVAIKASGAVVSLIAYSADADADAAVVEKKRKRLIINKFSASGTIIETFCADNNDGYTGLILTSASIIRASPDKNDIINDLKIAVSLPHGEVVNGELQKYDLYYNIAVIKVKSNTMLSAACLTLLDDSLSIAPIENSSHAHTKPRSRIFPGHTLLILGRSFKWPCKSTAFFGKFSIDCCHFDCQELLRVNCKITESTVGGPVTNLQGELIGIVYHHDDDYTPFLPINIISQLLNCYKFQRVFHRPFTGLVVINLYAAELNTCTQIVSEFPGISGGVLVEEVKEGSPAHSAQLQHNDLIVRFNGKDVSGTIQFNELMLEYIGTSVELIVLRTGDSHCLTLIPIPEETRSVNLNRSATGRISREGLIMDHFLFGEEEGMASSKASVWKRKHDKKGRGHHKIAKHSPKEKFCLNVSANIDIDFRTKKAVHRVSDSVVSIICCSGENEQSFGSGIIVESNVVDGICCGLILTMASLIRQSPKDPNLLHDLKLKVLLSKGRQYDGYLIAWDHHYNIALIRIKSEMGLKAAHLKQLDDSMSLDPNALPNSSEETHEARASSEVFNIFPGDRVIAVGRYFADCCEIMAAPGVFSANRCDLLDCKELLRADCRNKKVGIGGPIINTIGEVIGVAFYAEQFTPFLPINLALRWLRQDKNKRPFKQLFLGMEFSNLYTARLRWIEKFSEKFPSIGSGIVIEKITPNSSADMAGLQCHDVITKCNGVIIQGNIHFFEMMSDKVGSTVELIVLRVSDGSSHHRSFVVDETSQSNYNCWPLPKEGVRYVSSYRE